jgi:uncharacterized protein
MNDGEFEWDDRKATQNVAKHGVRFEIAKNIFLDPFAIDQFDVSEFYDEQRFNIIGMVGRQILFVTYTMRGETIRLISARDAEPYEHRQYHDENDER